MIKQTNWIYLVNSNNGDYIRYNLHLTPDNIPKDKTIVEVRNDLINEILKGKIC